MELPVVIFVSAITGAVSSIVVLLLARSMFSKESLSGQSSLQPSVDQKKNEPPKPSNDETSPIPRPSSIHKKTQVVHTEKKSAPAMTPKPSENPYSDLEDVDEENILTASDLSHHIPKLARFKELNIPSIDDDSIQVSESEIPAMEPLEEQSNIQDTNNAPQIVPSYEGQDKNPSNDHDEDLDDDATVLVQRTPPK